jgi:hypothetical protein
MASSLSELRARVKRTFIRTDKDTEINEAINSAYMEMVAAVGPRKLQEQEYIDTVVGREDYLLPTLLLRVHHPIRLIDPDGGTSRVSSYPLQFISKDEYDVIEPNPNSSDPDTGRPWAYTIWKNSILITDVPDQVYTLEINMGGEATNLSADSDEVIFSDIWDETIVAGALTRMYHAMKLYDDAKLWQGVYLYGYIGDAGVLQGGLTLLKQIEKDNAQAPILVKFNSV